MRTPMARAARRSAFLAIGTGLLFSLVLAGCGLTGGGSASANQPGGAMSTSTASASATETASSTATVSSRATSTPTSGGQHAVVRVIGSVATGYAFLPATITIKVGATVTWINATSAPHTSTSDIGSTLTWDSHTMNPEGAYRFTFTQVGTFHYHCGIHPGMRGTIIVIA
ncbi:MAG TPA: plastocyanin/azurin family copper-binding protein [Ktedonobacterales bacterium]